MSEQLNQPVETTDEKEPVYYNPKTLSLVSSISMWFSWLVLIGFVLISVAQYFVLMELAQGTPLADLIKNPSALNFVYANVVVPFVTGLGLFVLLQAASIGLNVLLEIDFGMRENKS